MLWLALAPALGLAESVTPLQPPVSDSIVVTRQAALFFCWPVSSNARVEFWNGGRSAVLEHPQLGTWVPFSPNQNYAFRVFEGTRVISTTTFRVVDHFEFHQDGRVGEDAVYSGAPQDGKAGTSGGSVRLDLSRSGANVWLELLAENEHLKLLLADPGSKILITARGGDGGRGSDGLDFKGPALAIPGNGGEAGWGGRIEVTVHQMPWREYLDLDVSPGRPGPGGRGGNDLGTSMSGRPLSNKAPDGRPGQPGQSGHLVTQIAD